MSKTEDNKPAVVSLADTPLLAWHMHDYKDKGFVIRWVSMFNPDTNKSVYITSEGKVIEE